MPTALLVEDDKGALHALAALVENLGFSSVMAGSWSQARAELLRQPHDVVLLDVVLPGGSGIDLLLEIPKDRRPHVVLMSGDDAVRKAFAALPMQELHFVQKPIDVSELQLALATVRRRCARQANGTNGANGHMTPLAAPNGSGKAKVTGLSRLLGESPPMRLVRELIVRVAPVDLPVLIEGESGTGKELVALSVHEISKRSSGPFVALNCGALPENLIDSELFGHERGSFTGAERAKAGVFEQAHGGTLFLDEVSEMPAEQQVRLLRTLETGRVRRVGGSSEIEVDVRILAATNRRLDEAIAENRFREDLLHRLCVFPIVTPPLRRRPEDVELLARHFLAEIEERNGRRKELDPEALARLVAYEWPGNVRQLRNVMERAYVMSDGRITPENLPEPISAVLPAARPVSKRMNGRIELEVGTSIAEAERLLIEATLLEKSGDKRKVAETLGVSLRTLYKRLKLYANDASAAE
jgi:two-component system, NtrC family, response regulator AtoC